MKSFAVKDSLFAPCLTTASGERKRERARIVKKIKKVNLTEINNIFFNSSCGWMEGTAVSQGVSTRPLVRFNAKI
jgi:hypothetical protein